jgi:3-dehydroquinate dehydratase I
MIKPKICAVIIDQDAGKLESIDRHVDLFEVRIDLIGEGWVDVAMGLGRPWIAASRKQIDGGKWTGDEDQRLQELMKAAEIGANIVDIELETPDLKQIAEKIGKQSELLISHHDFENTPPLGELIKIVEKELDAGAKICKIVTRANSIGDNITLLELVKRFPGQNIISFCMGEKGVLSRVLAPLAGSYLSYAALKIGKESVQGQLTVEQLIKIYSLI